MTPLKLTALIVGLLICALIVSIIDSVVARRERIALAEEQKVLRREPGFYWSKKCESKGKRPLIMQSDGKPPVVRCVDGWVKA